MEVMKVIILGFVEGLTEFIPVSSTGHLILLEEVFTLGGGPGFRETFMIVIQLPAILAVVFYFWSRLWPFHATVDTFETSVLWIKIGVAFLPAAVIGVLLHSTIEAWLFGSTTVALALVIGGFALLGLEASSMKPRYLDANEITFGAALGIGFFQCLAMIPGTSRSAATIIGAMVLGANRRAAAEFSFFLAIPTMVGATVYQTYRTGLNLTGVEWAYIGLGGFVAFVTAYVVVAAFMNYIRRRSFRPFGYYRILVGLLILLIALL